MLLTILNDPQVLILPSHGLFNLAQIPRQVLDLARVELDAIGGRLFDEEASAHVDEDGGRGDFGGTRCGRGFGAAREPAGDVE